MNKKQTKKCPYCGLEKPLSEFYKRKNSKWYRSYCIACEIKYGREWNRKNKAKRTASTKRWQAKNYEKSLEMARNWRKRNPDKVRELCKKWRKTNPEKLKKSLRK